MADGLICAYFVLYSSTYGSFMWTGMSFVFTCLADNAYNSNKYMTGIQSTSD
jgi:hypothetical protein